MLPLHVWVCVCHFLFILLISILLLSLLCIALMCVSSAVNAFIFSEGGQTNERTTVMTQTSTSKFTQKREKIDWNTIWVRGEQKNDRLCLVTPLNTVNRLLFSFAEGYFGFVVRACVRVSSQKIRGCRAEDWVHWRRHKMFGVRLNTCLYILLLHGHGHGQNLLHYTIFK